MIRILLCLGVAAALGAPTVSGVNDELFTAVVEAIATSENCARLNNPGCIRNHDGTYHRYASIEDGMRGLRREVRRRAGKRIEVVLESYNPGVEGYAERVARIRNLDLDAILP